MIGSAIERGSLICAFDQHGMTLFSKGQDPATDCWDSLVPPSRCDSVRSSTPTTRRA
jgi:hypothetical protein